MKTLRETIKKAGKKIINSYLPERIATRITRAYYARLLKHYSEHQEPELAVIRHCIKQGDSVIDIGANIGVYTKFLSILTGVRGKVYSLEPVPPTFEILCGNIKALKLNNIKTLNCACMNHDGQVTMEVPYSGQPENENFYYARVASGKSIDNNFRKFTVDGRTLDSLLADSTERISFIKCDVEGSETSVLRGAIQTIAKFKPIWFIEIVKNPDDDQSPAYETFLFLRNLGYAPFYFDDEKLRPRKAGIKKINYFFLSDEHISELTNAGIIAE